MTTIKPFSETRALEWGLQPEKGYKAAWGARAIYKLVQDEDGTTALLDVVQDRTSCAGNEKEVGILCRWLDATGFRLLTEELEDQKIDGASYEAVTIAGRSGLKRRPTIKAGPRGSHGYLYIVAYL